MRDIHLEVPSSQQISCSVYQGFGGGWGAVLCLRQVEIMLFLTAIHNLLRDSTVKTIDKLYLQLF